MNDFRELNIREGIVKGLAQDNIKIPTKIQQLAIPPIMEGKDLIGEAMTGSGKTLAYLLPSFEKIDPESKDLHTLVLAPTHELVLQIERVIQAVAKNAQYPVRSVSIIGNVNISRQIENLKAKPHIIVGTPGRILELIKAKKIKAHLVKTIVIDEVDKLLSDDNQQTVNDIVKTTLRDRQILAFSASLNARTLERATTIMKSPEVLRLKKEEINNDIEHYYIIASRRDKLKVTRQLIHATKPKKAIVFLNKNELIQDLNDQLLFHKIKSVAIFGNGTKEQRKKALRSFSTGDAKILVASDLVARGLDLPAITHIINLDIPSDLNEYTHRAGRTGRAGKKGVAISIITENEVQFIKQIEKKAGIKCMEIKLSNGYLIEAKPGK